MTGRMGRRIAVLASGTVIGQGLVLLVSPILTRLYDPDAFGVLGVFVALVSIAGVVVGLRYPLAVPLPEDDAAASDVLLLSLASVGLVSVLVAAATWFAQGWLRSTLGLEAIASYLWILPLVVAISGAYDALNYWAVRTKGFKAIAQTRVSQGLATALGQVALGAVGLGAPGLVAGQAMGRATGIVTLLKLALRTARPAGGPGTLQRLTVAAVRYRRFPLYSTWSALANTLSVHLPIMLLTSYFGVGVAGLYTLSTRVLQSPISIVGTAVSQVFLSDAAGAARAGTLGSAATSALRSLARLGLPLGLMALLAAPAGFEVVFGAEWRTAGTFTQLLVPWLVLVFLTSPLSVIPSVVERQGGELVFNLTLLAARVAALVVGGVLQDPLLAVALYGGVSALGWAWFLVWTLGTVGEGALIVGRLLLSELWRSLPYVLPALAAFALVSGPFRDVALVAASAAGVLLLGVRLLHEYRRGALHV